MEQRPPCFRGLVQALHPDQVLATEFLIAAIGREISSARIEGPIFGMTIGIPFAGPWRRAVITRWWRRSTVVTRWRWRCWPIISALWRTIIVMHRWPIIAAWRSRSISRVGIHDCCTTNGTSNKANSKGCIATVFRLSLHGGQGNCHRGKNCGD